MSGSKQLFVLRHAKSSWDDPALADHDRPLAPRGRRAVQTLAEHFRTNGIKPALVFCSSSRRTRETLDGIGVGGQHLIEPDLYAAGAPEVLERLRSVSDDIDSVMVVGHNPAMQTLVLRLVGAENGADDDANLEQLKRKFPTGALATITFDGSWSELSPGSARLSAYVRPKSLGA